MLARQAPASRRAGPNKQQKLVADGSVLVGRALAASANRVQPSSPSSSNAIRRRRREASRSGEKAESNGWSTHSALQQRLSGRGRIGCPSTISLLLKGFPYSALYWSHRLQGRTLEPKPANAPLSLLRREKTQSRMFRT